MCEKKLEFLLEDEDRYLRQLESDVITLSERLDNNQVKSAKRVVSLGERKGVGGAVGVG